MNEADRDAAAWQIMNQKAQQRELYRAKETGDAYYINGFGEVIVQQPTNLELIKNLNLIIKSLNQENNELKTRIEDLKSAQGTYVWVYLAIWVVGFFMGRLA